VWVTKRIQKLLVLANSGDQAARAQADALLKKHHLCEADIPPVRPRGRPREIDRATLDAVYRELGGSHVTQRTKENSLYMVTALHTLCGDHPTSPRPANLKRWAWLLRPDGNETHQRNTILSQLGRVSDERALKIFADRLCQLKPRASEAVRLLREWDSQRTFLLVSLARSGAAVNTKAVDDASRRAAHTPFTR